MSKIKVLIADDHSIIRIGLSDLLTDEGSFEVVATASNGEEAVALTLAKRPDVVIMDLLMPQKGGIQATSEIMAKDPTAKIMVLTSFGSSADMNRALGYGAVGAQMKEAPTDSLIEAIHAVLDGGTAIAPEIRQALDEEPASVSLTERQRGILQSVARGLTNKEISAQYDLSPISVKKYLSAIFAKIGAANRTEAASIALRKHLLKV